MEVVVVPQCRREHLLTRASSSGEKVSKLVTVDMIMAMYRMPNAEAATELNKCKTD
jgi:hypothetical protein